MISRSPPIVRLSVSTEPDGGSDTSEYIGAVYTLTIGGKAYDQDAIADPVYSAIAPNHGMYGIATSCFSCDVYTGVGNESDILQLTPCSEVTFSALPDVTFILTDASFRGKGVVSITAYTRYVNSDIIMTAETFLERDPITDKKLSYSCASVAAAALSALYDTGGCPSAIGDDPYLYVSQFKGKSARHVLEEISKVNGGYFFDNQGAPDFAVNGGDSKGSMTLTSDDHSAVSPGQTKNISRVFVTGVSKGDFYEVGSGEYYNTETLSGDYLIGETICKAAAAKMFGAYEGWKCDNILADGFTPVLHTDISFEGTVHSAEKITVKYTKNHSIMSAGSDSFSMSYADYSDMVQRALNNKIEVNKDYGCSGIDSSYGVYFVDDEEGGT